MKPGERILGVEGGGTKTAWILVEPVAPTGRDDPGWEFHVIDQGKLPPSNFRLTTPERLRVIFAAKRISPRCKSCSRKIRRSA